MSNAIRQELISTVLSVCACGAWANSYSIADLGVRQYPVSVNNSGSVASNFKGSRGDIFRNGKWRKLSRHTELFSINRYGDVVGDNYTHRYPELWLQGSKPLVLPVPPGGDAGVAYGINDSQTIVGSYMLGVPHCFIWTAEQSSVDLGGGRFCYCKANDISNIGQVVGTESADENQPSFAFVWSSGVFTILGNLPGTRGFTWDGSTLIDWDPQHQYPAVVPVAIGNTGEGVGWAGADRNHTSAVRFAQNTLVILQKEVTNGQGWELLAATGINDEGVILGYGLLDGFQHGFVLTPQ